MKECKATVVVKRDSIIPGYQENPSRVVNSTRLTVKESVETIINQL